MQIITQNSYNEEIILAGLTSLLKKEDINECHYWFSQANAMQGDAMLGDAMQGDAMLCDAMLWEIYYDFYYELNDGLLTPTEGANAANANANAATANAAVLKAIITQWFYAPASPLVFLLRQAKSIQPKSIYIKPAIIPAWLLPFAPQFHDLLIAIKRNNYQLISYHVHKLHRQKESVPSIVASICNYYKASFIEPLKGSKDELQYIFAVYAKLRQQSLGNSARADANTYANANAYADANASHYDLPSEIGAFNLRRWRDKANANAKAAAKAGAAAAANAKANLVTDDAVMKLATHPQLIAMELCLAMHYHIVLVNAISKYIQSQLSPAVYNEMMEEKIRTAASNTITVISKDDDLLPQLGGLWLRRVFPVLEDKLYDLIEYKMFSHYLCI
jgi:hypothetical protein